jgi:GNAT superfamily N-acetyltransferase
MKTNGTNLEEFKVFTLTPDRWQDFETLFGEHGAYGNCWCMFWRMKRSEFMKMTGEEKKAAMVDLVNSGVVPGVMLYEKDQPIGWCSIDRRETLYPLERSTTLKRIDDQPVWSIVCFFVKRGYQKQGLMKILVRGAVDHARDHGARIVEAYPTDLQMVTMAGKHLTGYHGYMGIASTFRKSGFLEVDRPNEYQVIMRYTIQ